MASSAGGQHEHWRRADRVERAGKSRVRWHGIRQGEHMAWYADGGRPTAEAYKAIDIREIRPSRLLRPGLSGSWKWSRNGEPTGSVDFKIEHDTVVLIYGFRSRRAPEWKDIRRRVPLAGRRARSGAGVLVPLPLRTAGRDPLRLQRTVRMPAMLRPGLREPVAKSYRWQHQASAHHSEAAWRQPGCFLPLPGEAAGHALADIR
jgi:hypothetical protein